MSANIEALINELSDVSAQAQALIHHAKDASKAIARIAKLKAALLAAYPMGEFLGYTMVDINNIPRPFRFHDMAAAEATLSDVNSSNTPFAPFRVVKLIAVPVDTPPLPTKEE